MEETKKTKEAKALSINDILASIQKELKAPKNQFNKFANFYYRSCEDILEGVKPLLKELTLIIQDEVVQVGERYYVKATVTITDGKRGEMGNFVNSVSVSAFAREAEVKTGMDSAQITGATSSYARKYALNGLFAIDDTADPDSKDNTTAVSTTKVAPKKTYSVPPKPQSQGDLDVFDGQVMSKNAPVATPAKEKAPTTPCPQCNEPVSKRVEEYSVKNYGKVLCMACQLKEKAKQ